VGGGLLDLSATRLRCLDTVDPREPKGK